MSAPRARLVLASASPRRRELLARAGLAFTVDPADVDEDFAPDLAPEAAARLLAERKARAVAVRHAPGTLVLGADTIVAVPRGHAHEYLGKPRDAEEAAAMLARLAGTRHAVVTGLCVVRAPAGPLHGDHERTWVRMRALASEEIRAYVASGEWRDKAGGYAIQESADRFVTDLEEGGFDNVVGLPVARALALLAAAGG
ncbi:MAG TPA: Maf family protein [Planctomycetota bacterium]